MASHRPSRTRSPHLRLALTPQTGSPYPHHSRTTISSQFSTPLATPTATRFARTTYSPFLSANLNAPSSYGSPVHFSPRRSNTASRCGRIAWLRLKRSLGSRALWLLLLLVVLMIWWLNGGSDELDAVKLGAAGLGRDFFQKGVTRDMQFFPAANPKIHVCGYPQTPGTHG